MHTEYLIIPNSDIFLCAAFADPQCRTRTGASRWRLPPIRFWGQWKTSVGTHIDPYRSFRLHLAFGGQWGQDPRRVLVQVSRRKLDSRNQVNVSLLNTTDHVKSSSIYYWPCNCSSLLRYFLLSLVALLVKKGQFEDLHSPALSMLHWKVDTALGRNSYRSLFQLRKACTTKSSNQKALEELSKSFVNKLPRR